MVAIKKAFNLETFDQVLNLALIEQPWVVDALLKLVRGVKQINLEIAYEGQGEIILDLQFVACQN
jgi:hypothetical protein